MSQLFKNGDIVKTEVGRQECRIVRLLGQGGQGEVYEATIRGHPVAIKWYKPIAATEEQRRRLKELIQRRAPSSVFLWPDALVLSDKVENFGYLMPLREPNFRGLTDLMNGKIEPTIRATITAGISLAHNYYQLHSIGLCYQDISWNNVFFDPDTGEIRICDNDNVTIDKTAPPSIYGTPLFMAPEIVRGDAAPSIATDRFSLAVLLFYLLMSNHPLHGEREYQTMVMDDEARMRLHGYEPVFIYDPQDASNRPVRGEFDVVIRFWEKIYPQILKDRFIQAFTAGIRYPHLRVVETIWRKTLIQLRDLIIYCTYCEEENFYDPIKKRADPGYEPRCWNCTHTVPIPPAIKIGSHLVMLNIDSQLFPYHIHPNQRYDFSQPIADVREHPDYADIWGLRNLSGGNWRTQLDNGEWKIVEPGRSIILQKGTKIHFGEGKLSGEFVWIT